jgi:hypothetical protein
MKTKIKLTSIPTFGDGIGNQLQFVRIKDTPGFSHRVVINRRAIDWLANNSKPGMRAARFFYEKHHVNGAFPK